MSMPGPGDVAPSFEAVDENGRSIRLRDYQGRWVVIFFYPKDDARG